MIEPSETIIDRVLYGDEHIGDLIKGGTLEETAALMLELDKRLEEQTKRKSTLQAAYDHVRLAAIPSLMENLGLKSATIEGVGRVTLTADAYIHVAANDRGELQSWLTEHGFDDLITQTVNASTLKAWTLKRVRAGEEIPPLVKISPFTRASITKV